MSTLLPEALQAMLKHAAETHKQGNVSRAETEYLAAYDYAVKVYHEYSPVTGLVLLSLTQFYEESGQKRKAAVAIGRVNALVAAHHA